jgi:hypothetical protein
MRRIQGLYNITKFVYEEICSDRLIYYAENVLILDL